MIDVRRATSITPAGRVWFLHDGHTLLTDCTACSAVSRGSSDRGVRDCPSGSFFAHADRPTVSHG